MKKTNKGKKYRKYKRMTQEEIDTIFRLYNEKVELRKIARILNRSLSAIQYQLKKNKEKYNKN